MSTKEWLNRGYMLDKEIAALCESREKAFELARRAGIGNFIEKVQTSPGNINEERFLTLAEYDLELKRQIKKLYGIMQEISLAIEKVQSTTLRTLLIERYINFKTWEQIAERLDVSVRWVYIKHNSALNEIKKVINSL